MSEQTAYLGYRKFLSIGQVAGHIMPNRMKSKLADTSLFAYGAHELWAMYVPGAGVGVEKHPYSLKTLKNPFLKEELRVFAIK